MKPEEHAARLIWRAVDRLMPELRDTQWRVLVVVIRQTAGRGRREDWIAHGQWRRRTGRASEAICGAIASLSDRGLIEVASESGRALDTAALRRRERGRLLFRPGPVLLRLAGEEADLTNVRSPNRGVQKAIGKAKTTELVKREERRFRNVEPSPIEPPAVGPSRANPVTVGIPDPGASDREDAVRPDAARPEREELIERIRERLRRVDERRPFEGRSVRKRWSGPPGSVREP